jgi:hypothetical protein
MADYLKEVDEIEPKKRSDYLERIKQGRNYVTIRVDGDIKEIVLKHNLNIQGTFALGVLLITDEIPKTLQNLFDNFQMNEEERDLARKYFIGKFLERTKKNKMCYLTSICSYAVYKALKEKRGNISLEDIFKKGGVSPVTLRNFLKEEGEESGS